MMEKSKSQKALKARITPDTHARTCIFNNKKNNIQKKYQQTGITLVALIVTIIILLILAGVTLNLALSNNGIMEKATYTSNTWANATKTEREEMEEASRLIDEIVINLPSEYQRVEYIESTGTQYIDMGIIPKATLNGKLDLMCMNYGYPFGSTNGQNIDYWGMNFYKSGGQQQFELYFGTGNYPKIRNWEKEVKYNISIIDKKFYCNNELLYDFNKSNNSFNFNTNKTIYLFGLNYQGGRYFNIRFYRATFWDNNQKIKNFIPCYTTTTVSDVNGYACPKDTIGMYDTVEGKFYTNQGTGTFLKGNDL